jgi:hypothetical protein
VNKAACPSCARVIGPVELGALFPRHNVPGTRKRCVEVGGKVRRSHLVHPCQVCAALPAQLWDGFQDDHPGREYRPREPRPLSPRSGPRSPLCASHQDAKERGQRAQRNARARERDRGISEQDRQELWLAQGSACVCGRTLHSTRQDPTLDHSHRRARELCGHDPKRACRRCARGRLCDTCNRILVGRYSPAQLRAVALYMENPTAARLGWWDDTEETAWPEESPERSDR